MSWEYDPANDSSNEDSEDLTMLQEYMDEVRDKAIQKLTLLELCAIYDDFNEFCIRYREERDLELARNQME